MLKGNQLLSVPVQTDPDFSMGVPSVVVKGPYVNVGEMAYGVTSDSQKFLMLKPPEQPPPTKILVVANWFEELERLVPTN